MRALAEIAAIVQKAALGAGIPAGQAEDLGRIAAAIAGTGGDVQIISDALTDNAPPHVIWDQDMLLVETGSVALVAPVIRDAFVMGVTCAKLRNRQHLDLVKATLSCAGYEIDVAGQVVTLRAVAPPPTPTGPVMIADHIWEGWAALAAKTYVPESEASRLAGAGAGLTDND